MSADTYNAEIELFRSGDVAESLMTFKIKVPES